MRDLPRSIGLPEVCKAFFVVKVCTLFSDLPRFFADLPHYSADLPRPVALQPPHPSVSGLSLVPGKSSCSSIGLQPPHFSVSGSSHVPGKSLCAPVGLQGPCNAGSCPRPSFFRGSWALNAIPALSRAYLCTQRFEETPKRWKDGRFADEGGMTDVRLVNRGLRPYGERGKVLMV